MITVGICDDERIIRAGIQTMIEQNSQNMAVVGTATNGVEACTMILEQTPEVVLLDINMPGMSGLEVIEQVGKQVPTTQFIIVTGYDEFSYAQQAIQLNVFDYLLKPFQRENLFQTIENAAQKSRAEQAQLLGSRVEEKTDTASATVAYILKEYRNPEISLAQIAEQFFISESYLSRIIKKETGKSYSDFITSLRMEEAKRILSANKSILSQEVAEAVGYPNRHYFCRVFKQYTGVSPTEYRDAIYEKEKGR